MTISNNLYIIFYTSIAIIKHLFNRLYTTVQKFINVFTVTFN